MYHVLYVSNCTPQTESLKSKKELKSFLSSFVKKHGSLDDGGDNWIDHVFKGKKLDLKILVKVK